MTFRVPRWPRVKGSLPAALRIQSQSTVIVRDGSVDQPVLSPEGRFLVYESGGDSETDQDRKLKRYFGPELIRLQLGKAS